MSGICRLTLARPKLRNALDPTLIEALTTTLTQLADDPNVRVIVLASEGKHFCAGADLQWMRASAKLPAEENQADAMRLGALFAAIDRSPKPVVARVQGAAIGGGAGLAAVCDVVIAEERAVFAFAEVRLGLIPAVIAPFVVAKIGFSHARALFVSGERIDAAHAARIGLVHETATMEKLDEAVERNVAALQQGGPQAIADVKALLRALGTRSFSPQERLAFTAQAIAKSRSGVEGQAGLAAFLEHRKAPWIV